MKRTQLAQLVALLFVAGPALAQQSSPSEPKKIERVEVTGSSIKRIQDEGALPLQVITREQIDAAGILSAEQLMDYISANGNGADNLSSKTIIAGTSDVENRNSNSNASANLRGLGPGSTLVLLNGRRVALHGLKAGSVDLNSIPLAAVERVEILKDGASALYGTDAIGGVINFILRKDYQGVQLTALADMTQDGGGHRYRGSLLAGAGSLARDRYNAMVSLTFDRQDALRSEDRSFSNGFQPDRGLSPDTAGTPFATQTGAAGSAIGASFRLPGDPQAYTRANLLSFQGNCADRPHQTQYQSALWATPSFRFACAFDYTGVRVLIQPVDRVNLVARGTMQFSPRLTGIAEFTASSTESRNEFEQQQITTSTSATTNFPAYPVNGPYYQNLRQYIPSFDPTKPIAYRWRCMDCGPRIHDTESKATRLLVGLEGEFKGWDWKAGVSSGRSWAVTTLAGGYFYTVPLRELLASGQLNPWLAPGQTQTPQALAALEAASARGAKLLGGKAGLTQFDGAVSGELMQLPGGPLALAAGFDHREETYIYQHNVSSAVIGQVPDENSLNEVDRTVTAFYAELAVPIVKRLEATLAVRRDDYSDVGATTNPKASLAWRPVNQLLVRGSWGEGFRAPSFVQLYGPTIEGPVQGNIADPVLCPQNPGNPVFCAIRPNARTGGNRDLQPETSEQWNVGFVVEPANWFTASMDFWEVKRKDLIVRLSPQEVVLNFTEFPDYIARNPDGTIDYIRAGLVNAADEITRGVELGARINWSALHGRWTAGLDGTYIDSYRTRIFAARPYTELVGEWSRRGIYPRWKHVASVNYATGPWSTTFLQRYVHSYKDEVPLGPAPGFDPEVEAYIVYDLNVTYTGIRNLTLAAGVKNLLNTDPPFTAHQTDFVSGAGWDPRIADPRGRAFIVRATYTFK